MPSSIQEAQRYDGDGKIMNFWKVLIVVLSFMWGWWLAFTMLWAVYSYLPSSDRTVGFWLLMAIVCFTLWVIPTALLWLLVGRFIR